MLPRADIRGLQDRALAVLLFIGAFASGLTPIADGDVFWHLAAGREMVRTGALMHSDAFSISANGHAWIDVHWLFQLALFGVERLFGLAGLVYAKCASIGFGALVLYAALDRAARRPFVPMAIGALFFARHLLLVRPVIATLLFIAFFFYRLERLRRHDEATRLLVQVPLAQVVWSNCQGLFAIGPALVAAYAIGSAVSLSFGARARFPFACESGRARLRTLSCTLLACLLASLATPYGLRALALPVELLLRLVPSGSSPYQSVAENLPPFLVERFSPEQFWHLSWFLIALASSFAAAGRRIVLSHLLIVVGMVALALISNRNVLLLYWIGTPIAALQCAPTLERLFRARPSFVRFGYVPHALSMILLSGVSVAAARETSLAEPSPFHLPVRAVHLISHMSDHGSLFSADHQGGYVIWKLYPRFKPYIDTRLVLRSADQYREYLELADHPGRFDAFQKRYGFSYVILPVAYPDRYLDLIAHLHDSPDWKLIDTDGADVLFAATSSGSSALPRLDLSARATTAHILDEIERRFAGQARLRESARIQLATLEIAVGAFSEAEHVLSEMTSPPARTLQARARLAAGDLDGAEQIARHLIRGDDRDAQNLDLMAMLSMRRGRLPQSLSYLRRALSIDPFDSEATRLLGKMEEYQHAP
ncbi:MAG TPA: hypothetical protein VGI70_19605 [Polyangiales bacterium]